MQKPIELVLVQDEAGVYFGLCDGSAPPVAISTPWPPKTGHDVALKEFASLLGNLVLAAQNEPAPAPTPMEAAAPVSTATA